MAKPTPLPHETIPITLLNLVTLAVLIAWLAVAAYSVEYLASH